MRILPEICPNTTWPFSSFTRKVALGRFSMTSPCIWITSSLAIVLSTHRDVAALEVRLLEQRLILLRHNVRLHLRHEVHRDDDNDQQRRSAKIKRHVPAQHQKF